ncbi:ADP-ribosylglycohydrolase family protein [Bifidobacterium moukalabense]|uniref:ADP-ribosylglycohydrolase family protein n=1 Tax=Bifidobacterium moukalabense TaxID=1333651 RepID=UPI0010F5071C|nr:ADP-ribosylglycohydrolase family protein [Bifidobacterium moukalabense]
MMVDERLLNHARGAMVGLAVGDALGMPTQSMSPAQIVEYYGGPIATLHDAVPEQPIAPNMKAGAVTDDTEQAFVLAERLVEDEGRLDNDAYAKDLLRWEAGMKAGGSLDLLGPSTKAALQALTNGVDPEETGRFGTTNGGAMRVTPVGIAFRPGRALADAAWRSCVVTHNTVQGIESTTLVAAAVSYAIEGERDFLHRALDFVKGMPPRGNWSAKASVAARVQLFMNRGERENGITSDDEFATILQRDCGTSVEANESVAAAFAIAGRFFDEPTKALCFAASLGGDTDTIAAIAGAMLGAWHGPGGFDGAIAGQVLRRLKDDNRLDLERTVRRLCALRQ